MTYTTINCFVDDIEFHGILSGSFGNFRTDRSPLHKHYQHEVHVIADGEGVIEGLEGETDNRVRKNSFVLFPAGYYHKLKMTSAKLQSFNIRFEVSKRKKGKLQSQVYEAFERKLGELTPTPVVMENDRITAFLCAIGRELNLETVGSKSAIEAYFTLAMAEIVRSVLGENAAGRKNTLLSDTDIARKALIDDYVAMHFSDPDINLCKLAGKLGISERQARRIFEKYYRCSFRQYITDVRLSMADKLLKKGDVSIKKAAESLGFRSLSAFGAAFKKKYGVAPKSAKKR